MSTTHQINHSGLRKDYLKVSHQVINVARLLGSHIAFGLSLWMIYHFLSGAMAWLLTLVAIFLHQKEMSEWVHEASHYNLLKNRKWNDLLINAVTAPLFGVSIAQYRNLHFSHHSAEAFFTSDDPDTRSMIARNRHQLYRDCLLDLTGVRALQIYLQVALKPQTNGKKENRSLGFFFYMCTFHSCLLVFFISVGQWQIYFLYMLNLISIYQLFSRLRTYGQHAGLRTDGTTQTFETRNSRTMVAGFWDRVVFNSKLMLYHHEHHLYPTLPYRALEAISQPQNDPNLYCTSRWSILKGLTKGEEI